MTLNGAVNESVARLKLLRAAARRVKADNVLALMSGNVAAFAAVMTKDGQKVFEKTAKQFQKAAENYT